MLNREDRVVPTTRAMENIPFFKPYDESAGDTFGFPTILN